VIVLNFTTVVYSSTWQLYDQHPLGNKNSKKKFSARYGSESLKADVARANEDVCGSGVNRIDS
jgi:hypothetical protein